MISITMQTGLLFAGILFLMGFFGVMFRRNIIFMLMAVEVMLNAAGVAFVIAGSHWLEPDGQVMFIFILTMTAAEVSVGLAILLQIHKHYKSLDTDAANKMKG